MTKLFVDANASCKVENEDNINCCYGKNSSLVKESGLFAKYTNGKQDIIYSSIDEVALFTYDEKEGCLIFPKLHESTPSQDIVDKQEYEAFKPTYDFLDNLDIIENYKKTLCFRCINMPMIIKEICKKYLPKLKCMDTNSKQPRFEKSAMAIFIDQHSDLTDVLGAGNQFMHEIGHGIAYAMVLDHVLDESYDKDLANCIQIDYHNAILTMMNSQLCSQDDAQRELSEILKENCLASNAVSDVFGGISGNKVRGCFFHDDKTYWSKRGLDAIGREFFANVFADLACCNDEHIAFVKKYMPLTMLKFEEILKGSFSHESE